MPSLAQLRRDFVPNAEITLQVRMPPNFVGRDSTEASTVNHRTQRDRARCDRTMAIRQPQIKPATGTRQLEWRAIGARAPKFGGCDGAEETAFGAWQAFTFHQHLAVSGIKRHWLPCRAIVAAEEQDHRRADARMIRMHAQREELVSPFGTAQLDARRFADLDRGERLAALVQHDGGDLLARPFNRLVQIVERLALERHGHTASATAAGSLRARVKAM